MPKWIFEQFILDMPMSIALLVVLSIPACQF